MAIDDAPVPRPMRRAARQFAAGLFGLGQRIAGCVSRCWASRPAWRALRSARLPGEALFGLCKRLLGLTQDKRRLHGFGIEFGQPVLLRQPLRGGGRRVGTGGEAIPAPERALAADQPLAGRKKRLQPAASLSATIPICARPAASCAGA